MIKRTEVYSSECNSEKMENSQITDVFHGHRVGGLKETERAATAGDGCMWKEVHGWTDDVISGPQTVIDIAYISSDVYSTGLHGFPKGTP